MKKKTLGILGGMGPAATVHFYNLITSHTHAGTDADHLNIILTSSADIPDRTDFILGVSDRDPFPYMLTDALKLEAAGANVIAIPCNTAQYFRDRLAGDVHIPILDIVRETSQHAAKRGFHRAALLATEGTVKIGSYASALSDFGVECITPDEKTQALVTSVIYDYVKAGKPGGEMVFAEVSERMFDRGCDCLILGCTELPLVSPPAGNIIDSLEVLAYRSIDCCGGSPKGFSTAFLSAYEK